MSEMSIRFRQRAYDRVVNSLKSSLIVEAVLRKGGVQMRKVQRVMYINYF